MISSRRFFHIAAATVFCVATSAHAACPPTPNEYRDLDFGHVRFAIEEGCASGLTQNEQFFVAGIAKGLWSVCKLPRNRRERATLERFTRVTELALSFRKPDGPINETLGALTEGVAAFGAGLAVMEDVPCRGPAATLLSRGVVLYLKNEPGKSRFVTGCVTRYKGKYTEQQCQCIANTLRSVLPDVDERYFDKEIITESINHAPFIAAPLWLSCGLGNY